MSKKFYFLLMSAFTCAFSLFVSCSSSSDSDNEVYNQGSDDPAAKPINDTKAPSIFILTPTSDNAFVTTDAGLVIAGTAQDDYSISKVTYATSAGAKGVATGLESWSINDLNLPEGDTRVDVKATDIGGNSSSASIMITKNKYITFLGLPAVDKDMVYCNSSSPVWITARIAPNEKLIDGSVKLIEIDEENQTVAELCTLYDDGNLTAHADEIKGDNVYSFKYNFNLTSEGTKRYRIAAKTLESEGEVIGYSSVFTIEAVNRAEAVQQIDNMMNTQQNIKEKLAEIQELDEEAAAEQLTEILVADPTVEKVIKDEGLLKVQHKSGLESYVMLSDNYGMKGAGSRNKTPMIPLKRQTRGFFIPMYKSYATRATLDDDNIIQNKRVLVWSAFADKMEDNMGTALKDIFDNSPVKLKVDYRTNLECSKASLQEFTNYGIVVIDTHGWNGDVIFTRDAIQDLQALSDDEIYDLYSSAVKMFTMRDGNSYAALTAKFIKSMVKTSFPNSIIFNGSCESLKDDQLANAFISKGAKAYLGFTGNVSNKTCTQKAKEFFSALVGDDLKTTGQAFQADLNFTEPDGTTCSYLMRGSNDMHFYLGLINGDFEYGNLNGWEMNGDGRVISQLGNIPAPQGNYMGIISTGLGFTENYGSIRQTFRVAQENTLRIKWNYLSEEFMEYVGSQFQDFLKITIIDEEGNSDQVFYKAIDNYADEYDLVLVSPDIVFDRGDVYKTDWKVSDFDITRYQGKTITLVIESGDVGDSIYDSAVLLDEIEAFTGL